MAPGMSVTIKVAPEVHPEFEYEIVVVPAEAALTIPVPGPMVATAVLLLAQVPPVEASDRMVVPPLHKTREPVIAELPMIMTCVT
jgi:hypothetical protein